MANERERAAFAEAWKSPEFRQMVESNPEMARRMVQRRAGSSPQLLTPREGAGTGRGIQDALSAIPRFLGDAAAGAARTVGNIPNALSKIGNVLTGHQGGAEIPRAEEVVPDLAAREGGELGDLAGTAAAFLGGGGAAATTRLGPVAGPALADFVMGTGESGSVESGAIAAALGALPASALSAVRASGLGRGMQESGLRSVVGPKSLDQIGAFEESIPELAEAGLRSTDDARRLAGTKAEDLRGRIAQRESELATGRQIDVGETQGRLRELEEQGGLADFFREERVKPGFVPDPEKLTVDDVRALGTSTGSADKAIAELAAADPEFARRVGALEEVEVRRPSTVQPTRQAASQVEGVRQEIAAKVRRSAQDLGIPEDQVGKSFNSASDQDLLRIRNTLARSDAPASKLQGELGPPSVKQIRLDIADSLEETLLKDVPPGETISDLEDAFMRWSIVMDTAEKTGARAASDSVSSALGGTASSYAITRGALLQALTQPVIINTAARIIRSSKWPAAKARLGGALANALASGNAQAVAQIAGRMGAAGTTRALDDTPVTLEEGDR